MNLTWTLEINDIAEKQLRKLDPPIRNRILDYLYTRIHDCKNPRYLGEPLKGNKSGLWRYRVGDYRIICEILNDELIVVAIAIAHRRLVYKT